MLMTLIIHGTKQLRDLDQVKETIVLDMEDNSIKIIEIQESKTSLQLDIKIN